jgi:hypothetical protein
VATFITEAVSSGLTTLYGVSDANSNYCGPYLSEAGHLYFTCVEKIEHKARVVKSTDGGLNWSVLTEGPTLHSATLTGVGSDLRRETLGVQQVDNKLWIAYRNTSGLLAMTSFELDADTWGGQNPSAVHSHSVTSGGGDVESAAEGLYTAMRGNSMLVFHTGIRDSNPLTSGYFRSYVTFFDTAGGSWGTSIPLGFEEEKSFFAHAMIAGSEGRTHLWYSNGSDLYHVTMDSSNTLHTHQLLFNEWWDTFLPYAYSKAGQTRILIPSTRHLSGPSTAMYQYGDSANDPVWTSEDITTAQPGIEINPVQARIVVDKGTCLFTVLHLSTNAETARIESMSRDASAWGARSLLDTFDVGFDSSVGHYSIRKIGNTLHGVVSNFAPFDDFVPMIYYFQFDLPPCGRRTNYSYLGTSVGSLGTNGVYSLLT